MSKNRMVGLSSIVLSSSGAHGGQSPHRSTNKHTECLGGGRGLRVRTSPFGPQQLCQHAEPSARPHARDAHEQLHGIQDVNHTLGSGPMPMEVSG